MPENGDYGYILSFLADFSHSGAMKQEYSDIIRSLTEQKAREVADVLRQIEESHLPLTIDMYIGCILGGV